MDRYVGRCKGLVVSLQDRVAATDLDLAQHLIDHGEAPEGIRVLAWALAQSDVRIEEQLRDDVVELMGGMIDDGDLPDQFRSSAQ